MGAYLTIVNRTAAAQIDTRRGFRLRRFAGTPGARGFRLRRWLPRGFRLRRIGWPLGIPASAVVRERVAPRGSLFATVVHGRLLAMIG
jgi:hypothetical protein